MTIVQSNESKQLCQSVRYLGPVGTIIVKYYQWTSASNPPLSASELLGNLLGEKNDKSMAIRQMLPPNNQPPQSIPLFSCSFA